MKYTQFIHILNRERKKHESPEFLLLPRIMINTNNQRFELVITIPQIFVINVIVHGYYNKPISYFV